MGLKDLAKKKLLMQELNTVDDEDESSSDEPGEGSSEDGSASDDYQGKLAKKKKQLIGKSASAPGFAGKLDQDGAVTKRRNPLKMWASKMGGYATDSDS
jgi:hypothetical protein